jgi:hypothetical protein
MAKVGTATWTRWSPFAVETKISPCSSKPRPQVLLVVGATRSSALPSALKRKTACPNEWSTPPTVPRNAL